jgi:hypothetical protein
LGFPANNPDTIPIAVSDYGGGFLDPMRRPPKVFLSISYISRNTMKTKLHGYCNEQWQRASSTGYLQRTREVIGWTFSFILDRWFLRAWVFYRIHTETSELTLWKRNLFLKQA